MKNIALMLSAALALGSSAIAAPVTNLQFSFGLVLPDTVELLWTTTAETQNLFFRVQRSHDGVTWTNVTTVPGNGTTAVPHNYSFTDLNAYIGVNYYRLRQVDSNLTHTFSQTLTVDLGPADCGFYVHPNPAHDNILINWEGCDIQYWNLKVLRLNGVQMMNQDVDGLTRFTLNISGLPNGNYILMAEAKHSKTLTTQFRKY